MSLAFIPLYIHYIGMEAYGLIGLFAVLQAWLVLLDMGMTPTLSREMARFRGGSHSSQSIRDLLRSIEIVAVVMAAVIVFGVWGASRWLATEWLHAERLPAEAVARAFAVMGVVSALRFIENIYRSSIIGLQRQILLNVATGALATLRSLGAVGVLAWISPTIEAFFIWQGLVSIVAVGVLATAVYGVLPASPGPAKFSRAALADVWRFAAGMIAIVLLSLLLTQIDKILLSRLLTLEAFGYYSIASVVTGALSRLAGPITQAFYPRFTELVSRNDQKSLTLAYHRGAQLIAVLMGSAAIVLIFFGDTVLRLWTCDPALAQRIMPLVRLLALGTLLNGLMLMPYQLQLSYGWTELAVRINIVAVLVLVPLLLWIIPTCGPMGAAGVWVVLNIGYVAVNAHFMHRHLLPKEKWRWYWRDVAAPLGAATATAALLWCLLPSPASGFLIPFVQLTVSIVLVLAAACSAASLLRQPLARLILQRIRSLCPKTV